MRKGFSEHRVEKVYRAIALGRLDGEGRAELPLLTARHRPARVRVATDSERDRARGVRVASLAWRALEPFADATLVEVRPVTGFLHQIRAIFAHLGFPLAGDRSYGAPEDPTGAERQTIIDRTGAKRHMITDRTGAERHMLHASSVALGDVAASSPDAADFEALVTSLRKAP